jgi:hypothetical protein
MALQKTQTADAHLAKRKFLLKEQTVSEAPSKNWKTSSFQKRRK